MNSDINVTSPDGASNSGSIYKAAIKCAIAVLSFAAAVLFFVYCDEMAKGLLDIVKDALYGAVDSFFTWLVVVCVTIGKSAGWAVVVKVSELYSVVAIPLTLILLCGYMWCACILNTLVKKGETGSAYFKVGNITKRMDVGLLPIAALDMVAALNSLDWHTKTFSGYLLFFAFVVVMAIISSYTSKSNPLIFKKGAANEL